MARRYPFLHTATLTNANQVYNLKTLMQAVVNTQPAAAQFVVTPKAQVVSIQLDKAAGGATLFIGDPDTLSTAEWGVQLLATQAWIVNSVDSNLINLSDIGLLSDTAGVKVGIMVITR